jgi:hypothetical protein
VAGGHEIDACLKKMDCGRVADHVRMDSLGVERRRGCGRVLGVLRQEVPDAKACQRLAATIAEELLGR